MFLTFCYFEPQKSLYLPLVCAIKKEIHLVHWQICFAWLSLLIMNLFFFFFYSYLVVEPRFCHHLDIWGLKQLFILDHARLTQWRLSLSSILRSADWVLNWNSLAVWLLTITSFKKNKKQRLKLFFTRGSEVRDCLLITSSVESRTKTSSASPSESGRSHYLLLLNCYFWLISNKQSSQLANTNQVEIKPVQRGGGTLITHITRWASELSITRLAGLVLCIPTASAGWSPVH